MFLSIMFFIYQAFIIYYHYLFVCAYLNVGGQKYMFSTKQLLDFGSDLG